MSVQQPSTSIYRKETTMKIKLITALTTIALFALPVADAFAGRSWC
jgi:hypothetical protein